MRSFTATLRFFTAAARDAAGRLLRRFGILRRDGIAGFGRGAFFQLALPLLFLLLLFPCVSPLFLESIVGLGQSVVFSD
jgi:hypothetical protein